MSQSQIELQPDDFYTLFRDGDIVILTRIRHRYQLDQMLSFEPNRGEHTFLRCRWRIRQGTFTLRSVARLPPDHPARGQQSVLEMADSMIPWGLSVMILAAATDGSLTSFSRNGIANDLALGVVEEARRRSLARQRTPA